MNTRTLVALLVSILLVYTVSCGDSDEYIGIQEGSADVFDTASHVCFTHAYDALVQGESLDITPSTGTIPASEVPASYVEATQSELQELIEATLLPASFDLSTWAGIPAVNSLCGGFAASGLPAQVEFQTNSLHMTIMVESSTLVSTPPSMVTPSIAANIMKSILAIPADKESALTISQVTLRDAPGGPFAYGKALCDWSTDDLEAHPSKEWYSRILFIHQPGRVYYFVSFILWDDGSPSPELQTNDWEF